MPAEPDVVEEIRTVLAEIERLSEMAIQTIQKATDVDRALEAAKESYPRMRAVADEHGELRTAIAGRVWHAHRLSLSALAERVGVSKSRAEQLIKEVKKNRGDQQ